MKFLTAVTICLVLSAGAQATFFDDLKATAHGFGDALKQTFGQVLEQGKQVGQQLLGQLGEQGKQLFGQAAQSLLLNVMQGVQQPSTPTKKDLSQLVQHAHQTVEEVKQAFGAGVSSLGGLFHAALGKLKDISTHLEPLSPQEIKTQVDNVVSTHKHLLDGVVKNLVQTVSQKLASAASHLTTKRADHDFLHKVQSGLTDFLHSHTDQLHKVVEQLGHSLTHTTGQMQGSVDQHMQHLGDLLHQHLSQLGQDGHDLAHHGHLALDYLKQLIASSMHKPATNDLVPATNDLVPEN